MKKKRTKYVLEVAFVISFAFALPLQAEIRCPKVTGTYLTTISFDADPGPAVNMVFGSRSVITLRGDGTMDTSDSGQQGKNDVFDPFGESKGVYVCRPLLSNEVNIKASLINFTLPGLTTNYLTPDDSQAISRTDYNLLIDTKNQTFEGTIALYKFTMETDLDNADNPDPLTNTLNPLEGPFLYLIKGRKVGVVE